MLSLIVSVVVLSVASVNAGYLGEPLVAAPLPVYGAHYAPAHYGHAPIVKTVSSVAVAHTPVAHSYSNTYKVSHPVLRCPTTMHLSSSTLHPSLRPMQHLTTLPMDFMTTHMGMDMGTVMGMIIHSCTRNIFIDKVFSIY
ncbi:uncharacterized protein LOC111051432 [Nilaparvata lugens]|uniref:uncharacterized protein LOC111051432 n=1 Tax=Nilaparvata lugens TaxID=108931 RepID=UPI00193CFC2A|nr:uncharacterized protein LOC111051432 [Nilaparvata lugens]